MFDQNLRNQDLDSFVGEELPQQLLLVLSLELSNGNLMVQFGVSQMSLIDLGAAHILKHSKSSSLSVLSLCIVHVLQEQRQKWLRHHSSLLFHLMLSRVLQDSLIVSGLLW